MRTEDHVIARVLAVPSRERRPLLMLYGGVGLAGLLLSACWVMPMIADLRFVPTQSLGAAAPGVVVFTFLRLGAYLFFGGVAAAARRDGRALALVAALVLLLAFALLPSERIPVLRDLALQPIRVLVPFPFLSVFMVGYLVSASGDVLRKAWARPGVGVACAAVFFLHFKLETEPAANLSRAQVEGYENVLGPLAGRTDGRVLVEMGPDGISDPFALQALAGMRGARAVTTVFRESALDVMFAVPLRNSFSGQTEAFGIDHKINGDDLKTDPTERHLSRLELFNVRYFAARSPEGKTRVASLPGVHRESPQGRWELWAFDAEAPGYATVPEFAPVLAFSRFSVKPRASDGVDFVRLGEEMFAAGRLRVPLALAQELRLERTDEWTRFGAVLITEYRYESLERAFEAVEKASRERPVVLWPSADPLFARLRELAMTRPALRVVEPPQERSESAREKLAWGRAAATRILDALDAVKVPIGGAPKVVGARLSDGKAVVSLDRVPAEPTPLWVRQGYFPSWKSLEGEPVYLATPTFQLTFTRQQVAEVRYERRGVDWAARVLSLLGLGVVGLVLSKGVRDPKLRAAGQARLLS